MNAEIQEAASRLISTHLVWDNHGCLPLRWDDDRFLPQLARYRDSGMDAVSINVGFGEQGIEEHVRVIAAFRHWLLSRPEDYLLIQTAGDVTLARESGRLGVCFDIEGTRAIGDQLSLIQLYYDLGVRWMLMAYNHRNLVGDGVHDPEEQGLTPFGAQVVAEMERVGMVVCCSHTGPRTAREVMERATRPVIFSHSNAKALWPNRRNIDDELMDACAATGGVVGINGLDQFLGPRGSSVEAMIRHIDYVAQRIGVDHVGIGLDYVFDMQELVEWTREMHRKHPDNPDWEEPMKFVAPEQLQEIVAGLLRMKYSEEDITRILGGNHLRIAQQVWK